MTTAQIKLPAKVIENFSQPARHRVLKGGRGSAKTRAFAKMSAVYGMRYAEEGRRGVLLASREHLNSLDESSLEEIKTAILSEPFLADYYDIGERYIRTKNRRVSYAFAGLRHNLDSIKSKANILLNWTDEAENVSEAGWRKLIPTIREEGSENWVSYNPESAESATHKRFVENPPQDCIITTLNWRDNPWFPTVLNRERLEDQAKRPDVYEHVWEGGFLTITDAQVFAGKHETKEFEPGNLWDGPYFGLDWGFAQDPTVAVELYIHDDCLWVRRDAGRTKLELDDTAEFILGRLPLARIHKVRADSARPESISYVQRKGLAGIVAAKKWPGSVEDGVEFIKSFRRVYVHPDCEGTAREFRLYSYKVDRLTGDIMPKIVDANNHYIDAIRYALQPLISGSTGQVFGVL
jgi:phage terminase large subunit